MGVSFFILILWVSSRKNVSNKLILKEKLFLNFRGRGRGEGTSTITIIITKKFWWHGGGPERANSARRRHTQGQEFRRPSTKMLREKRYNVLKCTRMC